MFVGDPLRVTVNSTTTLRTAAGEWYGRASVKIRNGIVILVYRHGSAHAVNDGELHIKFSDDYGVSWTAEDIKIGGGAVSGFPMNPSTLTAGQDAGEPWLYLAPNGNLVLHMWRVDYFVQNNGTYQSVSTDGGNTWSASAAVDFSGITGDDDIFATDDDFVYGGVIYAGARKHDADQSPSASMLIKSTDNGATWSYVSTIMENNEGASTLGAWEVGLEYLGDSVIIAMLRSVAMTASYKRISTDMGLTWGSLTDVSPTIGIAARQRVYTRAHMTGSLVNWWEDPYLIMTGFNHKTSGSSDPRQNAIWISQNRGTTWQGPFVVAAEDTDGGYGDIFYNPNNNTWNVISYLGDFGEAELLQYNLTITGGGW
jgi:hypothetical protein